jgi:hypothetical protein
MLTFMCLVLQERQIRILRAENALKDMIIQMLDAEIQMLEALLAGKAAAAA